MSKRVRYKTDANMETGLVFSFLIRVRLPKEVILFVVSSHSYLNNLQ